ncbi:amino acid permease-domain-containing protein [Schizophyllum commune]
MPVAHGPQARAEPSEMSPLLSDSSSSSGAASDAPREAPPTGRLHRGLSARQVQMIAISGTIGTGLLLGTGKSLAEGGPASILIAYAIVGFIIYVTLLLLGEMATQYPVAGSFTAYATRFFSPSYGFALSWNYWFNDAVSMAGDLTAAQLVLQFWGVERAWIASLVFWVFLVTTNSINVKAYGELEYWLSLLKVLTIIVFIILGILVNVGVNTDHHYIGGHNWHIPGAPFVGGFGGFAKVFVTASFAYGGTESLGITAGETKNPSKNMPRVVKFVFWRIMLFYILSILLIGLNVPWNYPNLSNREAATSPFTIVFKQAGSHAAASFINAVILTSVLSAGNHALFAGTRVLYGLATVEPRQAPRFLGWTTRQGVPLPALLLTSSISALCFGSSFVGSGELWGWIQNIIGVSNQLAWLSIGLASWRFRKAWQKQGRKLEELKFHPAWTRHWGHYFVIIAVAFLIIVQGWSSVIPHFSTVDFFSMYLEIFVMIGMFVLYMLIRRPDPLDPARLGADVAEGEARPRRRIWYSDLVDTKTVDLQRDQYDEEEEERTADEKRDRRLESGRLRYFWKVWYWVV